MPRSGLDPATATVALLPGSREKEVSNILPTMLEAANRLSLTHKVQFVVAVAPTLDTQLVGKGCCSNLRWQATVRTATHATYDALQHCDVAIVASGTATIEAALRERPMVVVYRVSPLTWLLGKFLSMSPFTVWSIFLPESRWFPNSFRVISLLRTLPVG